LRMGSKQEMTTASGVSSMITSTPVSVSRVRMLRPSRPMIRPFISSLGRLTVETVTSELTSVAMRWMVATTMSRALRSAVTWASCSIRLILTWASRRASFSRLWISRRLASSADRPEILSSSLTHFSCSRDRDCSRSANCFSRLVRARSWFSRYSCRFSKFSSFWMSRRSMRCSSIRRSRVSRSSWFRSRICRSLISSRASFFLSSASFSASWMTLSAFCSVEVSWNLA
jgi:hypothetical protein